MNSYTSYKGLPSMAGLLSVDEALEKGLTAEQSVDQLKIFHWTLWDRTRNLIRYDSI